MSAAASLSKGILISCNAKILMLIFALLIALPVQLQAQHGELDAQVISDVVLSEGTAVCDRGNRKFMADVERHDVLRTRFLECFPVAARKLLETSSGEPYSADEIRMRANALRIAYDDPVDVLVATCKALGVMSNDNWNYLNESYLVLFEVIKVVDIDHFVSAISLLDKDDEAMLGAARILFDPSVYFIELLDKIEWKELVPKLTNTVLSTRTSKNARHVIGAISRSELIVATRLLRSIAYEELHRDHEPNPNRIGKCETAFLALAIRNDQGIKDTVVKMLDDTAHELDRAALEVCMALLGETNQLSNSHFKLRSRHLELAALKAIEKYSGEQGVDILVYSALSRPSLVREEAAILLQRLSGQRWLPDEGVQHSREYASDAASWWKENKQAFSQPYVGENLGSGRD